MNILGLDWETYYDDDYTLKKLSTTAYIRDPRFGVHGVAYRWDHDKKSSWIGRDSIEKFFAGIDWKRTALLAHHAHFDGLILTHHFKRIPAYYYDTLSMGRAIYGLEVGGSLNKLAQHLDLGSKVEGYLTDVKGEKQPSKSAIQKLAAGAKRDCDLMWKIFRELLEYFPEEELDLINYTVRCFTEPVLQVDKEKALRAHKKVVAARKKLLKKVAGEGRFTEDMYRELARKLRSRTQFPAMLEELDVEPPRKISPSWLKKPIEEREESKKYTYAFAANDLQFLALKEHPDERVRDLVEAKLLCSSSIHETRPLRMIDHADPALTIYLNYWGARTTGRWSGGDKMNPQNLGRDGELREAIKPPKGHRFVVGDSTAIEAVMNAWFAGQWDLLEQFADKELKKRGEDPYTLFASDVFGRRITKKDSMERFVGKVGILGLGYQMAAPKLRFTFETGSLGPVLVLDESRYKQIVDLYRHKMTAIVQQWWTMQDMLKKMMHRNCYEPYRDCVEFSHERLWLPNEMALHYPNLRYKTNADEDGNPKQDMVYKENTKIYGGKLTENLIQAVSRVVIGQQYLRLADKYRMVLLAHDEIVLVVPNRSVNKAKRALLDTLSTPPQWCKDAPLNGEVGVFDTYVKM
jgi:DNA polymerase